MREIPSHALLGSVDLMKILERMVRESNQKTVAAKLGVSPQYVNDVLKNRRAITPLAERLGYEAVIVFAPLGMAAAEEPQS